jgi:uncharacterized protein (DUF4415 family)
MTARKRTTDPRYTRADINEVSDSPEITTEEMAKARPFSEVFPELAESAKRVRGKQKAPTKQLVSLRLDREVIDAYKSKGAGWQSLINETLKNAVKGG